LASAEIRALIFNQLGFPSLKAAPLVCHAWAASAVDILWRATDARMLGRVAPAHRALYARAIRELDLVAIVHADHVTHGWTFGRILKLRLHPFAIQYPFSLGALLARCSGGVVEVVVGQTRRVSFLAGSIAESDDESEDGDCFDNEGDGDDDDDDDDWAEPARVDVALRPVMYTDTLLLFARQSGLRSMVLGIDCIVPRYVIDDVASASATLYAPCSAPFASLRCFSMKLAADDAPALIALLARPGTLAELSLDLAIASVAATHATYSAAAVVAALVTHLPQLRKLLLRLGRTYGAYDATDHWLGGIGFDAASVFAIYPQPAPNEGASAVGHGNNDYNNDDSDDANNMEDATGLAATAAAATGPLHRDVFVPLHRLRELTSLSLFGTHTVHMPDAGLPDPAQQLALSNDYHRHHGRRLRMYPTDSDGAAAWRALLAGLPRLQRLAVGRPCTLPRAALAIVAECCRDVRELELHAPDPGVAALFDALDQSMASTRAPFPELRLAYLWAPVTRLSQS
jgi:hypothetical protein